MQEPESVSQLTQAFLPLNSNLKRLVFQHLGAEKDMLTTVATMWPQPMKIVRFSLIISSLRDTVLQ